MQPIAEVIIKNGSIDILRKILSYIDEKTINTAIAASIGYYERSHTLNNNCTSVLKSQKEQKPNRFSTHMALIKANCDIELRQYDCNELINLLLQIEAMNGNNFFKTDIIKYVRLKTGCSFKDAKFIISTVL